MWGAFAAVRNSFGELVDYLCAWLLRSLMPVSEQELPASEQLLLLWSSLGIEDSLAQILSDMKLIWDPLLQVLKISKEWADSHSTLEEVTGALLSI
eukprot:3658599-Karenia_brevis.AAC.1